MDLQIRRGSWPELGRVGTCGSGPAAGQHVLLVPESELAAWMLYLEPPWENFVYGDSRFTFDNLIVWEEDGQRIADDWQIEWLAPGEEELRLEEELFGIRQEIVRYQRSIVTRFRRLLTRVIRR